MHETHLRQPGFSYSACGPFTKNKERMEKFKERGRFKIYLLKRTRWNLLSTLHGICKF